MNEVTKWWNYLLPTISPLLRKNGGPVLMAQIEHYYGSSGICDKLYILDLANLAKKLLGNDVVLYSVDVPMMPFKRCGFVNGILPTIEMQPNSDANAVNGWFEQQQLFAGGGPKVGSQFILGPYTMWGAQRKDPYSEAIIIKTLQAGWNQNAIKSFHMAYGGTNFGFWNGNNSPFPVTTSYDSFAPISEGGDTTELFLAIRNFISKIPNRPNPPTSVPALLTRTSYLSMTVKPADTVLGFIKTSGSKCFQTDSQPLTAEDISQGYGFVYYQTVISDCGYLNISQFSDDAYVYLNGQFLGALYDKMSDIHNNTVNLRGCTSSSNTLEIIVENTGRNHNMVSSTAKGIRGPVFLDLVRNWKTCQVPFNTASLNTVSNYQVIIKQLQITQTIKDIHLPALFYGTLYLENEPMDTFIDTTGWRKGFITVNEYNIGRYWYPEGPQQTLFVPSAFLQKGSNNIVVYEFEGAGSACTLSSCTLKFSRFPIFK